jgi:hypothetical protein
MNQKKNLRSVIEMLIEKDSIKSLAVGSWQLADTLPYSHTPILCFILLLLA